MRNETGCFEKWSFFNPPMAKGGGGVDAPQHVFPIFLRNGGRGGGVAATSAIEQKLIYFLTMEMTFNLKKFWHK